MGPDRQDTLPRYLLRGADCRDRINLPQASSIELQEQFPDPVVIFMPEIDNTTPGGTMRLGIRPTIFQPGSVWSKLRQLYGEKKIINERHRHRYEVNPDYIEQLEKSGLEFVGKDNKGVRMEILEPKDHPWYVGVQFHPEYLSRMLQPSRPYPGFVATAAGCLERISEEIVIAGGHAGLNGLVNGTLSNGISGVSN
jgi:CTP synthase